MPLTTLPGHAHIVPIRRLAGHGTRSASPAPRGRAITLRDDRPYTRVLCYLLALCAPSLALAQCTATLVGLPATTCGGTALASLALDTTGGNFGPGAAISWSADVPGSFTCINCLAPDFTASVPVATTNTTATLTVTITSPACVQPTMVAQDFTLLATPQAGLTASTAAGTMSTSAAYAGQTTFVLCGSPVPTSTVVTFQDASAGSPNMLSLIGDWGTISMPGGSGNFPAGLLAGQYTVTNSTTGCADVLDVGVLVGPIINSISAQVGISGSQFGCSSDPVGFQITPTVGNPPGMVYTVHQSYDLAPTIDPVLELTGIPTNSPTFFDVVFPENSCGGTHAGGPNTAGIEVTPAYGCYQGPPVTPITTNGVYISDPPTAHISAPASACTGLVNFNNDSQGAWIDNVGICHTTPENSYWTVSGPAGGWSGGTLGDDGGTPAVPGNWHPGSDPLALTFTQCGSYTVTLHVAGADDCGTSSYDHVIDIQAPPPPFSFTIGSGATCVPYAPAITNGGPDALTCGGTYTWTVVNNGAACSTQPGYTCAACTDVHDPSITFTSPGNYAITAVLDNSGCPGSEMYVQAVTVMAPPTAVIDVPVTSTCIGGSVTATADVEDCGDPANMSYTWAFGNAIEAGTGSTITSWSGPTPPALGAAAVGTLTIDLTVTNSCGPVQAAQVAIPVTAAAPVLTVNTDSPVCAGQPLHLDVVGGPVGATYTWNAPSGASFSSGVDLTSIAVDPAVAVAHAGVWTVSIGSGACAAGGMADVVINAPPALNIAASDPGPLCVGDPPVDLVASEANNTLGSYQWQGGGPASNVWAGVVPAAPSSTYVVDFTATATGCTASASISITVVDVGAVTADPLVGPVCDQAVQVPLSGSPAGGTWTVDSGLGTIVGGPGQYYVPAIGSAGASVTLRYTCSVGSCTGSAVTTFTIQAVPALLVPIQYACSNDAAFPLSTVGLPAGSYTAMPPVLDGAGLFHPDLAGSNTVVQYCTGTGSSCAACANGSVTVQPAPVIAAFGPITLCAQTGPYALPIPDLGGTWAGAYVEASPGAFAFNTDAAASTGSPYTLTYSVADASDPNVTCTSTADLTVNVLAAPTAEFSIPPVLQCVNTTVHFQSTSTAGSGGTISALEWDFGDPGSGAANSASDEAPTHSFATGGTYTVTLTVTQANCTSTVQHPIGVQDQPHAAIGPADTTVCHGQPVAWQDLSTGSGLAYEWWLDPGSSSSAEPGSTVYEATLPCDTLTHHIRLRVDNAACPADTAWATVFVIPPVVADLLLSADTVCANSTVTVNNTSDCPWMDTVVTWDWDYTNGDTQVAPNDPLPITHQYANPGYAFIQHTIGLTVTNTCSSNTATRIVTVAAEHVVAAFTADPLEHCAPFTAQFEQSMTGVTEWVWDFDHPNGDGSLLQDPVHTYTLPGTYDAQLRVSNGCVSDSLIVPVVAHPPADLRPVATASPACAGTPIAFTLLDAAAANVVWDLGDPASGAANTASGTAIGHLFSGPGTYAVTVTGQDAQTGCQGSATLGISVLDTLDATFTTSPLAGCPPLTVHLQSTTVGASAVVWTIGDASGPVTDVAPVTSHVFTTPGTYSVRLMAQHPSGCIDSAFTTITVYAPVEAAFTADPPASCTSPVAVSFTNGSNGPSPLAYTWTFGVGADQSNAIDASYTYTVPGVYPVCLTATSPDGCDQSFCDSIYVYPTPVARFTPPEAACTDLEAVFTQAPTAGNSHWWFGDGTEGNSASHLYTDPGTYDVALLVVGLGGCTDSLFIPDAITVRPSPVALFSATAIQNSNKVPEYDLVDLSIDADTVQWDFGDGTTSGQRHVRHRFPSSDGTTYRICLTAYNAWGCWDTICTSIDVGVHGSIFVPNAFTPNGDGKNDLFFPVIDGYEHCTDFTFRIFDRWGILVKEFADRNDTWDGTYGGSKPLFDVYIWTLHLSQCPGPEPDPTDHTGHVTVIH